MSFSLTCADFFPELEQSCIDTLLEQIKRRKDPLKDQILVVVPSAALRNRLLLLLSENHSPNLYGVNLLSINQLCIQIALDSLHEPKRVISDSLFFPYALFRIAQKSRIQKFGSFRICMALYQSFRDLIDGSISPETLQDVLASAQSDPELVHTLDFSGLSEVAALYEQYESFLNDSDILNLHSSARLAHESAGEWVQRKNITSFLMYGFYDATQTQFDVLDSIFRKVHEREGVCHAFFPFRVSGGNSVMHPAEYAQEFYDRMYSLAIAMGGQTDKDSQELPLASGGIESVLFTALDNAQHARNPHPTSPLIGGNKQQEIQKAQRMEIFNAAGPYDEAWAIAKKILHLVQHEKVTFDRIMVVCRFTGDAILPIEHAFAENRIPSNLSLERKLSNLPFSRFACLTVQARESQLNNPTLLEFLSSPFLARTTHKDFKNLGALLEGLFIRTWEDWDRLKPLLEKGKLPEVFEFIDEEDPSDLQSFGKTVQDLFDLKHILLEIPERGTLPELAQALCQTLETLCPKEESEITEPVFSLLRKIGDYSAFQDTEISLTEFDDLLKLYFENTKVGSGLRPARVPDKGPVRQVMLSQGETDDAAATVSVGDIMQLRGVTADYVFVMGLNKDVFPRRASEDPFLPDNVRRLLRSTTGAGPAPKRDPSSNSMIHLKEGTQEDLLLFSLGLRSAKKKLFLSYLRADSEGRKTACSSYLDEILRILTGKTSEKNDAIFVVPKHHKSKFLNKKEVLTVLPSLSECATLTTAFAPQELFEQIFRSNPDYFHSLSEFAIQLGSPDLKPALAVDGRILDSESLWKQILKEDRTLHLSYSRFKNFLQCPFQFFSHAILQLQESPRDSGQEDHDINPLMKGRLAEAVVKGALRYMRSESRPMKSAVDSAAKDVQRKYSDFLPPALFGFYMKQFRIAAEHFIAHIIKEGYDLSKTETPEYEDLIESEFLVGNESRPTVTLRGIPDLLLYKAGKKQGLIGELKWGSKSVANTPGGIFSRNEAQFCTYPALVEKQTGMSLPFQYFRLDVFSQLGLPGEIIKRMERLQGTEKNRLDIPARLFGGQASGEIAEYFGRVQGEMLAIVDGNYRIIKEAGFVFTPCTSCSFTQLCRRTHTPTLLRAKQAEKS